MSGFCSRRKDKQLISPKLVLQGNITSLLHTVFCRAFETYTQKVTARAADVFLSDTTDGWAAGRLTLLQLKGVSE